MADVQMEQEVVQDGVDVEVDEEELRGEEQVMSPQEEGMSAAEQRWWRGVREVVYQAMMAGARPGRVRKRFGVGRTTLYTWRKHPYWVRRAAREEGERAAMYAEELAGVDMAAVGAMREHVVKSGHVAFKYLDRRGLLEEAEEDDFEDDGAEVVRYVVGGEGR